MKLFLAGCFFLGWWQGFCKFLCAYPTSVCCLVSPSDNWHSQLNGQLSSETRKALPTLIKAKAASAFYIFQASRVTLWSAARRRSLPYLPRAAEAGLPPHSAGISQPGRQQIIMLNRSCADLAIAVAAWEKKTKNKPKPKRPRIAHNCIDPIHLSRGFGLNFRILNAWGARIYSFPLLSQNYKCSTAIRCISVI